MTELPTTVVGLLAVLFVGMQAAIGALWLAVRGDHKAFITLLERAVTALERSADGHEKFERSVSAMAVAMAEHTLSPAEATRLRRALERAERKPRGG